MEKFKTRPVLALAILSMMTAGCVGVAEYTLTTPDGMKAVAKNTKDYDLLELKAVKRLDGTYSVHLKEVGVSASDPMRTVGDTADKLIDFIQ